MVIYDYICVHVIQIWIMDNRKIGCKLQDTNTSDYEKPNADDVHGGGIDKVWILCPLPSVFHDGLFRCRMHCKIRFPHFIIVIWELFHTKNLTKNPVQSKFVGINNSATRCQLNRKTSKCPESSWFLVHLMIYNLNRFAGN